MASAETLVIEKDTAWEGTVDVAKSAVVTKGATLLIQLGTTVHFTTVRDEKDQPTNRLFVNGTIIAQGTAGRPITFMSSAKEPHPGDWGGIVVENTNHRVNRLRHVVIRDAFIGEAPLPGEWHGFLGEKTPRPVVVDMDRAVEGIDPVVRKKE